MNMLRESFISFNCNQDNDISDFLKHKAEDYERRDKARTYLYFDEDYLESNNKLSIIGYFTVALKTIKNPIMKSMSKTLRKKLGNISDKDNNIVSFLIGQLGRNSIYSKDILNGDKMMQGCYDIILEANRLIGGKLILLECKPIEKLCKYYEDKGYIDITESNEGLKQYIKFIN